MSGAATTRVDPGSAFDRLWVYARLGKLNVYQHWAPVAVAWSLLEPPLSTRAWLVLVLFAVSALCLAAAGAALDDVQGARDGLDAATYRSDEGRRSIRLKPLLTGELNEAEAVRFGKTMAIAGAAAGLGAVLVAPHKPAWLLILFLAGGIAATQYAYGLKLSYLGGGEWLLAFLTFGAVAVPVVLITGQTAAQAGLSALLCAWLFAQVTVFSNSADAREDRSADRLTIAARLTSTANRRYVALVFAIGFLIAIGGIATGALPAWLALTFLPVWALGVAQVRAGLGRGDWLAARALGWRAFDVGLIALIAANLLDRYV